MDNRFPLEAFLPTEPSQAELLPRLEVKVMSGLACTNRSINTLFKPALDQHAAKQLLTYVLQGNAQKAKAMYTANPGLLFIETTALEWASGFKKETDAPTHRSVQMSPLSGMLAAGDKWMFAEAMEVLASYVDQETQLSGASLAAEQMQQQFPNGFDYPPSTYDFNPLITAITNDQHFIQTGHPSDATVALIEKFRNDFMPGIVRKGYLFNLNELVKAIDLYEQNSRTWSNMQLRFFWCQVIGYLERLVPAVFAQAISQGLAKVVESEQFQRSMSFINYASHKTISYFPLDSDLICRLGLGFGIDNYQGIGDFVQTAGSGMGNVVIKTYIAQQQQTWKKLCGACGGNQPAPREITNAPDV